MQLMLVIPAPDYRAEIWSASWPRMPYFTQLQHYIPFLQLQSLTSADVEHVHVLMLKAYENVWV